jgi:hypothetical protein
MTTKQKKAFTAWATATAALGLLTGPALAQATPTASTGCTQWQFMGNYFALNQSNGYYVQFPATGQAASGLAAATPVGGHVALGTGPVSGGIQGRSVDFTIHWSGATGRYAGYVSDDGFVHDGFTYDLDAKGPFSTSHANWDSTVPLRCVTPAAPAPQPAPPPAPPLPGTDPLPKHPVPVTAPPTPLPGTDPKPNHPVPVTAPPTPLPGTDPKPNHPVPVTATPTPLPGTDRKPNFPVP